MAISLDQIKQLLGQGLANEVVAGAVGCTPSYISQLLADEEFAGEVTKLKVENLARQNRTDDKLARIEEKLIDNLEQAVDTKAIYKPQDVLRAFQVINASKRRGAANQHNNGSPQGGVVSLTIPVTVVQQFVTNSNKEVVAVAEQSLVTIAPEKLLGMLKEQNPNEVNTATYDKLLGRMPSAVTLDRDGKIRS